MHLRERALWVDGMPTVLIVKTGTALPAMLDQLGDFHHWFERSMDGTAPDFAYKVVEVFNYEALPDPMEVDGIIITGSPLMLTDREGWMLQLAEWTRGAAHTEVPLLGVCFGHQALAFALGGEVADNPNGREIGTITVDMQPEAHEDPLFCVLPPRFQIQATHVQSVTRLPEGAVRMGGNAMDPHHAFTYGPANWGVQFHPEFSRDSLLYYVRERRSILLDEGLDPVAIEAAAVESPYGTALMERFSTIVRAYARHRGIPGPIAAGQ